MPFRSFAQRAHFLFLRASYAVKPTVAPPMQIDVPGVLEKEQNAVQFVVIHAQKRQPGNGHFFYGINFEEGKERSAHAFFGELLMRGEVVTHSKRETRGKEKETGNEVPPKDGPVARTAVWKRDAPDKKNDEKNPGCREKNDRVPRIMLRILPVQNRAEKQQEPHAGLVQEKPCEERSEKGKESGNQRVLIVRPHAARKSRRWIDRVHSC